MMIKALVIGAGFLGSHIINQCEKNEIAVSGTNFSKYNSSESFLDITNLQNVRNYLKLIESDVVINCASKTNVDFLEKNPKIAFEVNTTGAENVAKVTNEMGIKLIHVSTDGVFDGIKGRYTENDIPNPVNVYAKSKYSGELAIKKYSKNFVIIRTNFYGQNKEMKFLFNNILQKLILKEKFIGFNDIIFSPLEINNLSQLIVDITKSNYKGIIHLASDEIFSKYDFCVKIAESFRLDKGLIVNDSVDKMNFLAKRPKNTSLDNSRSKSIIKHSIISFNDWLEKQVNDSFLKKFVSND